MSKNIPQKIQMAHQNGNAMVKCPREECGYVWEYSGSKIKATCPSCGYKCNVEENKVTN